MSEEAEDHSLAVRTVRGAGWIMVWRLVTRVLGIVNTVVLVRLLTPADFGLIALATSFAQAVDLLSSIGVADALIRSPKADRRLYDTGFTLNLLRGMLVVVVIAVEAAPIAVFFDDARLADILLVLAIGSAFSALENIGIVDYRRALDFQKELKLLVVPRVISIVASITAAFVFRSYWALVVGILSNRGLRLVMTYWMHPYRPGLSLAAWREIAGFSLFAWLCSLFAIVRDRCDAFVIGRVMGPAPVGVFSVGWEIGTLVSTELIEPATAALFSGFSQAYRTGGDLSAAFFKAVSAALLLTLPTGVGMSMVAAPVIHLAFGPQWQDAVLLVQVFALIGSIKVFANFSGVLLNAAGLIHLQFWIQGIDLTVKVVLLVTLITPYGLTGAAAAAVAAIVTAEIAFGIVIFRRFHLRFTDLIRGVWRCVLATAAMGGVLVWAGIGWVAASADPWTNGRMLAIGIPLGSAVYGGVLLVLWLLTGRPAGAETVFLDLVGQTIAMLRRKRA